MYGFRHEIFSRRLLPTMPMDVRCSRVSILLILATMPRHAEGGEALKGMLAPDLGFESDLAKLRAQIDGFKGGDVIARVPPERDSASNDVPAAIAPGPPRPRSFFIARAMPPVVLGAAAAAFALRSQVVQRAERRLETELSALAKQSGSRRIAAPEHAPTVRGIRQATDEVALRRELLGAILPLLVQLDQPTPAAPQLAAMDASELVRLNASLSARVEACGALIAEYEALGQPAPPGFRSWPVQEVHARRALLVAKGPLLREIIALGAPLGSPRLDWSMPEWSEERLAQHAEALRAQAAETIQRREHSIMLGKVEAAFWRRGEETPIATGSLSTEQLRTLLASLERAAPTAETAKKEEE